MITPLDLTPTRRREHAAIKKAQAVGGPASVKRLGLGRYVVPSASDPEAAHLVTGVGPFLMDYTCSCEAARFNNPCWHRASVALRRAQENAIRDWRRLQRRRAATPAAPSRATELEVAA